MEEHAANPLPGKMGTPDQPRGDATAVTAANSATAPDDKPTTMDNRAENGSAKPSRPEKRAWEPRGKKRKNWDRNDSRDGNYPPRKDRARQIHRSAKNARSVGRGRDADATATATADGGPSGSEEAAPSSRMSIHFTPEEIAAEGRRPKHKVAVLIGYAGTGYKGMQINHHERTIEGDLFAAFVATGAIAKVNADDPKKSSLIRCARTDKGVHAAGNVISLKMVVEDPDIVSRINDALPEQIRVWGVQRTNNNFNCYKSCDSRWYEYLLPSYSLLPPHPQSFLGRKIMEAAKEKGVWEDCQKLWAGVSDFWDKVDKNEVQPILDRCDPDARQEVLRILHAEEDGSAVEAEPPEPEPVKSPYGSPRAMTEEPAAVDEPAKAEAATSSEGDKQDMEKAKDSADGEAPAGKTDEITPDGAEAKPKREPTAAELAAKEIKAVYVAAKRRYRVSPERIQQLQSALDLYQGTNNFHNYTIQKTFSDSSAKRHIKSFVANPQPIQIRDTEWLSLKVHGQSFMMHQIRKMVAMAVLCVRCAAPLSRITESYGPRRISIPKAPGLGLLLERPVFESYKKKIRMDMLGWPAIDFSQHEKEIQEFKDKQIYSRMWETEERENSFHTFFHQLDNFNTDYFLWVTAQGFEGAYQRAEKGGDKVPRGLEAELGDEGEDVEGGEG